MVLERPDEADDLTCRRHSRRKLLVCGVWSCSDCFAERMERESSAATKRPPGVAVMYHKRVRRIDRGREA